ncbi:MAG: diadenylate cyclase CdaA [Eubacterium sp.]
MFDIVTAEFKFRYLKNLINSIIEFFSQVKGLFGTFGFIDVIDILFVAVVLYMVIRIIRETRAFQLIKGFVLLALVYFAVTFFRMDASSYIMRLIFSNILIIVVILFGPEIRNILEQMGKGTARNSLKTIFNSGVAVDLAEMNKTIDATCKACADMADDKVGALIVFENETLLGDIISTGTVVDAAASKELIQNIFYPKSPLHDGAMIVRGDKVYAAGCILPLTKNNDISSDLGTRHRAAIGISEISDAIVFVVSEENGCISCAVNGALQRNISTGDMRDILTKQYIPNGDSSDEKIISRLVRRFKK